jgi:hypothetical protein
VSWNISGSASASADAVLIQKDVDWKFIGLEFSRTWCVVQEETAGARPVIKEWWARASHDGNIEIMPPT